MNKTVLLLVLCLTIVSSQEQTTKTVIISDAPMLNVQVDQMIPGPTILPTGTPDNSISTVDIPRIIVDPIMNKVDSNNNITGFSPIDIKLS
jgi:hypothetical protein